MPDTLAKSAQIHIRVTPDVKRAVKVHCAQTGTTEQAWVERMIEAELRRASSTIRQTKWSTPQRSPKGTRG